MSTFEPKSVAVIGASAAEHKVGHMIFRNLVDQGYQGELYPINPKGGEILGKTVHTSVSDVPGEIELAVVVVPAKFVAAVAKECGEKGVQWLVVITAGFSEVHTEEGQQMEAELVSICNEYNVNLVGPNCLGVLRPSIGMNASFAKDLPDVGSVALVSQSGAMAVAIMDAAPTLHLGFSLVLSIGNKAQLDECDYLELCAQDEKTRVIGMYLESIKDGQRFLKVAAEVSKTKHIVLLKSGVSEHGATAASSHTGALAGSDAAIQAACKQTGVHRAGTAEEFLGLLQTLSTQPPLLSPNIAVITNAGGPGILATDAAEVAGLTMPSFADGTLEKLKASLPSTAGLVNPVDVIGDAMADRYAAALDACANDPSIDGVVVLLTPQVMTPCTEVAEAIIKENNEHSLIPMVTSFMGGESVEEATALLAEHGIPNFPTPERAVAAMGTLLATRNQELGTDGKQMTIDGKRVKQVSSLIGTQTGLLDENVTKEILALYGIPQPNQGIATTTEEAVSMANDIGYPVIAKISSPQILHKTDVGGIKANLNSDDEVSTAFEKIMHSSAAAMPQAELRGVLIQKFLPVGNEFIVGALRDPSFGPMIMVGLGGIYTELFKDTSFRIAPVSETDGYQMLQELESWDLLLGLRGAKQADIDGVVGALVSLSQLMQECEQITEVDFNPILVSSDGVIFADAKMVVT